MQCAETNLLLTYSNTLAWNSYFQSIYFYIVLIYRFNFPRNSIYKCVIIEYNVLDWSVSYRESLSCNFFHCVIDVFDDVRNKSVSAHYTVTSNVLNVSVDFPRPYMQLEWWNAPLTGSVDHFFQNITACSSSLMILKTCGLECPVYFLNLNYWTRWIPCLS